MKRVAIVGVEGSGKTVMLAGMGELYSRPDAQGYFLSPKNYETANYVSDKIERMRKGEWPAATAGDELQGLDWSLKRKQGEEQRPEDVCEVSFLDFAGEVYRVAFGVKDDSAFAREAESLKSYVRNADDVIVLINLKDIITYGLADARVREAMWITNSILSFALDNKHGGKVKRAAIVLSQADSYANTIEMCGGVRGVLSKYLPHVANDYGWLDILSAYAVDKTIVDSDGHLVPACDFTTEGLRPMMVWIVGSNGEALRKKGGLKSVLWKLFFAVVLGAAIFVGYEKVQSVGDNCSVGDRGAAVAEEGAAKYDPYVDAFGDCSAKDVIEKFCKENRIKEGVDSRTGFIWVIGQSVGGENESGKPVSKQDVAEEAIKDGLSELAKSLGGIDVDATKEETCFQGTSKKNVNSCIQSRCRHFVSAASVEKCAFAWSSAGWNACVLMKVNPDAAASVSSYATNGVVKRISVKGKYSAEEQANKMDADLRGPKIIRDDEGRCWVLGAASVQGTDNKELVVRRARQLAAKMMCYGLRTEVSVSEEVLNGTYKRELNVMPGLPHGKVSNFRVDVQSIPVGQNTAYRAFAVVGMCLND